LCGKTIGLVGLGKIGRETARLLAPWGAAMQYSARRDADLTGLPSMPRVDLDTLMQTSDVVVVLASLNPETRGLISAEKLRLMKQTAILVNTARGAIVDEAALARALTGRQIAGAGLDVFEHEPKVDPALLGLPNVVLTPHLGSAVRELREAMAHVVVDNILAILNGGQPPNCWNKEIYSAPG
jgi:glyoxylate reductase